MQKIEFGLEYFNIKDTLECGQVFRYKPFKDGYMVISRDKACYCYELDGKSYIESEDVEYFKHYFDLDANYEEIVKRAKLSKFAIVRNAVESAKGVRILNQDKEETFYSFIISQNNMIPRIKAIIERTCKALGERKEFMGEEYYSFPTSEMLSKNDAEYYNSLGYGYRSGYIVECSKRLAQGEIVLDGLNGLSTKELKKALMGLKGVGPKVADCVALFGYHRTDSFPVDTWIERLYREDFFGTETNRNKITEYFLNEFGEDSGYIQQYIFYYKRTLVKNII